MEIRKIGSRGTLFTFYDIGIATNVYVINGKRYIYIVDTYLGPDTMKKINAYSIEQFGNKPFIVINSHNHWDHVWGNSLYESSIILSHVLCRKYMEQSGLQDLEEYKRYKKGEVVLTYPNITFTDKVYFEEDDILVYHTPGHTEDEISIIDYKDGVLFAGDNLERPIPYLMAKNLNQYVLTLEEYLKQDVQIIIGGHTGCENKNLIFDNLDYVKKVQQGDTEAFEKDVFAEYHKANIAWLNQHSNE